MKRFCRHLSFYLVCLMVLTCLIAQNVRADDALDESVRKAFKKYRTSGGMVVVAKDGEIVYQQCYGWADKFNKIKVTEDTCFKLASVSKLVTGLSVMRLVEQGLLDLDENIGTYLGDPPYKAANPYFPKIGLTARHLMTHTSSLKSNGGLQKNRELSEILNVKKRHTSDFYKEKPGSVYRYNNYGAGIEGCLIEAATGKRLTEAAKELIFDPMGIDAAYHPTLLANPENIVTTYKKNGDISITRSYRLKEECPEEIDLDHDYNDAYGNCWMTCGDLCRIGIMLSDGGWYQGKQILQPETVEEMMSSQKGKGSVTVDSPYGLNIERVSNLLRGKMLYGHQGLMESVLCNLYYDPETHFVFAMCTNGCNASKNDRIGNLSRSLFNLMWKQFVQ